MIRIFKREGTTGALRAGLLLLVVLGVVGTAGGLAYDRHWDGTWQLVPWATLAGIGFALTALLARPNTGDSDHSGGHIGRMAALRGELQYSVFGCALHRPLGNDVYRSTLVEGYKRLGRPRAHTGVRGVDTDRPCAGDGDPRPRCTLERIASTVQAVTKADLVGLQWTSSWVTCWSTSCHPALALCANAPSGGMDG